MNTILLIPANFSEYCKDYFELCKPKVVFLMLITSAVGMLLATPSLPPLNIVIWGNLGIALAAFSAATINHIIDRHIDTKMARTDNRPIAAGRVKPLNALLFASTLAASAMWILIYKVNTLTAILSLATLLGYAVFYTVFLKRMTPQNIVIGGAAGAAPPLLGWAAVTNSISPYALLLVLTIFIWTPPHFWSLAIFRLKDYEKADIPMLPVTHGVGFTKFCILLYCILLAVVTALPYICGMSGLAYFVVSIALNAWFIYLSIKMLGSNDPAIAKRTFFYSIYYLKILFIVLLADHYF